MSDKPQIAIFADSEAKRRYLSEIVQLSGAGFLSSAECERADLVLADGNAPSISSKPVLLLGKDVRLSDVESVQTVEVPLRACSLLAKIQKMLGQTLAGDNRLDFKAGILDVIESIWLAPGEEALRLTEKEVEILRFLHEANGETVSRDELLQKVWAYAKDVETHTLETHIYRLRQKIEADPANPQILLTRESGYAVSM